MRKEEKEKLVRKVREAQEYPFPQEHTFLVELGKRLITPNRAQCVSKDIGLSNEEEKLIKWVAVFKKKTLEESPKTDFSKFLKKICKESEMDQNLSFKERLVKLKEEMWPRRLRPRNYTKVEMHKSKEEEKIKKFINSVIGRFEKMLQFRRSQGYEIIPVLAGNFYADSLSDDEFEKAAVTLKGIGFRINACSKSPRRFIQLIFCHRKIKGTTFIHYFGPVSL